MAKHILKILRFSYLETLRYILQFVNIIHKPVKTSRNSQVNIHDEVHFSVKFQASVSVLLKMDSNKHPF